ncbi:uncharacterized protein ACWYII_006939 isoform 2-T2 [Salvelinus alpinus]
MEKVDSFLLADPFVVSLWVKKELGNVESTAKLQLAKQNQDHPEDEGCQEKIQEIKQDIIKNKEALSEILRDFKYDSEESE